MRIIIICKKLRMLRNVASTSPEGQLDMGLETLPVQVDACVTRLMPAGDRQDQDVLLRLLEIGFLPGERVRVVARGFPAGDPMAVRVGNTTFALRAHEASLIRVSKTGAPAKVAP